MDCSFYLTFSRGERQYNVLNVCNNLHHSSLQNEQVSQWTTTATEAKLTSILMSFSDNQYLLQFHDLNFIKPLMVCHSIINTMSVLYFPLTLLSFQNPAKKKN